jgi:hypothetical protein
MLYPHTDAAAATAVSAVAAAVAVRPSRHLAALTTRESASGSPCLVYCMAPSCPFSVSAAAASLHAADALDAQRANCCSNVHAVPGSASATNCSRGTFQQHGRAHDRPARATMLTVGCWRNTPSDWLQAYQIICCRDDGDDVSSTADVHCQMQAIQMASERRAPVLPVLSLLLAADYGPQTPAVIGRCYEIQQQPVPQLESKASKAPPAATISGE